MTCEKCEKLSSENNELKPQVTFSAARNLLYKEALIKITKIQFEKDNVKPLAKAIFIAQAALEVE